MFAYCNNNPVIFIDVSGYSPFSTLNIADYYTIHKIVQYLCCAEYGWDMEVYVKGPLGNGSLDLYDYKKNQYYEVKSLRSSTYPTTAFQMQKYDESKIAAIRYRDENITSSPTRGKENVRGSFMYGLYDIEYELQEDGLIAYNPIFRKDRALNVGIASILIIGTIAGPVTATFGTGAIIGGLALI